MDEDPKDTSARVIPSNEHRAAPRLRFLRSGKHGIVSSSSIGKGTFSTVFKVTRQSASDASDTDDYPTGDYALKRFIDHRDGEDISIFALREIAILRAVDHPAIVQVLDVCDFSTFNHHGMGMLIGLAPMSLEQQGIELLQGKIQVDRDRRAANYTAQLASAVHYLHANGICHRDLKPANILCFDDYQVKICDFGSARTEFIEGGAATNEVQTIFWRAPELALGVKYYGMEVDVYSLGIIFAELYIGYCPIWLANNTVVELLPLQFRILEGMTIEAWPAMQNLPFFNENYLKVRSELPPRTWKSMFAKASSSASRPPTDNALIELVEGMTYGNPGRRLKMSEVLAVLSERYETKDEIARLKAMVSEPLIAKRPVACQKAERERIHVLLRKAYDLLLWLCIKTCRTNNFCYAKELIARYVTVSREPEDDFRIVACNDNTIRSLTAAALVISSKLHDVQYLDCQLALDALLGYPQPSKTRAEVLNGTSLENKISVDSIRRAERSILIGLQFDIIYPSQTELEERYIRNEEDFNEIPSDGEPIHDFHESLSSYDDFITVTYSLTYLAEVLGRDLFDLSQLTRLSMYFGLKIFNRRIKAVFSLHDIEKIQRSWSQYSSILLQETDLAGCRKILASSKIATAFKAAHQIGLFTAVQ